MVKHTTAHCPRNTTFEANEHSNELKLSNDPRLTRINTKNDKFYNPVIKGCHIRDLMPANGYIRKQNKTS